MKKLLLLAVAANLISLLGFTQVVSYPAPQGSSLNKEDYEAFVRRADGQWLPVPVYLAQVAQTVDNRSRPQNSSFAYFDFKGQVEICINVLKGKVNQVRIRPDTDAIPCKVSGNTITFKLGTPKNLSVEINGNIFSNLHLFANPLKDHQPTHASDHMLYYGPGLHTIGDVVLQSNQQVYISGGAVVQGRFIVNHAENVKIGGHGVLTQLFTPASGTPVDRSATMRQYGGGRTDAITIEFSKNVQVNGIVILPHKYTVIMGQSSHVSIDQIKSFSFEGNGDGLDIFCCTDVKINRVFMRNSDDCIAIYGHRWGYYGNTTDIVVTNSILWADLAHPVLIGTHGDSIHPDTLSNIRFKNIDIMDQHENQIDYQGCLSLNAGDDNLIRDVVFDQIRIADIRKGQLFNLRIMFNKKYNTSPGRGIENILFKDIQYSGNSANLSIISGYDDTRKIRNVTFDNLTINGRIIYDSMPSRPSFYKTGDLAGIFIGEHVENYKFLNSKAEVK